MLLNFFNFRKKFLYVCRTSQNCTGIIFLELSSEGLFIQLKKKFCCWGTLIYTTIHQCGLTNQFLKQIQCQLHNFAELVIITWEFFPQAQTIFHSTSLLSSQYRSNMSLCGVNSTYCTIEYTVHHLFFLFFFWNVHFIMYTLQWVRC